MPIGSALHLRPLWQATIGVWWLLGAMTSTTVLRYTLGHDSRSRQSRLVSDLLSAGAYLGAMLAFLSFALQLPLSGLVATSGIVAVVLGLALQSTLADLFSGIAVGIEQPFRLGDRISIGDRIEGTVSQINWRSIRISTDDDDVAVVPNSAVAKSEIVNRSFPARRRGAAIEVEAVSSAAPERVQALVEHALLLVPAISDHPRSGVHLTRLGRRFNRYSVHFFVDDPTTLGGAKSDFLRLVRSRLLHADLLELPPSPSRRETRDALASLELFRDLSDEQMRILRLGTERRQLRSGDLLFAQGDVDTSLYVVEEGVLEVRRLHEGGRLEIGGRLGAGEYIGEIGLLTGAAKQVSTVAIAPTSVQIVRKEALEPLIRDTPRLADLLEASVKRGYALLRHDAAVDPARAAHGMIDLLPSIRAFFGLQGRSAVPADEDRS